MNYICDSSSIDLGLCTQEQFGTFILSTNATDLMQSNIITRAIHLKSDVRPAINYPILRTGYYCISTAALGDFNYKAVAEFRNAYGELPGAQIAKLPFYGGLAIVYAVIGIFWAFLYVQNRHDILPVQNYITATIIFLVVEMLMMWGYYDYQNRHGNNLGAKVFMLIVSVFNAARNSLSFFLLLIVCMGYGVVKHTLGKTMIYVRILALTHFVFGVLYATASLTVAPEDAGPLVFLIVLPLAATLTAFYVWTLNSLSATLKDLFARKQRVKAMMYKKLWWCILGSILTIFGFFFLNAFLIASPSDEDFTPNHWQTRWFILDGWLNLVYLCDVAYIAYLWRPTANNRRFAMSDEVYMFVLKHPPFFSNPSSAQISQDDEGFEIASVRDSDDLDDDAEAGNSRPPAYSNRQDSSGGGGDFHGKKSTADGRSRSPLPAPTPQRAAAAARRESLDRNETIFAVGEDGDRFSLDDDDSDDEEQRRGLNGNGRAGRKDD